MRTPARVFFAIFFGMVLGCGMAAAQQMPGVGSPRGPFDTSSGPHQDTGERHARMLKEMARQRNVIRQKEIVADTDRLLELANQLKTAVDKSNKNELSLNVVDTAAAIEKLAKQVKQKMRDGQ